MALLLGLPRTLSKNRFSFHYYSEAKEERMKKNIPQPPDLAALIEQHQLVQGTPCPACRQGNYPSSFAIYGHIVLYLPQQFISFCIAFSKQKLCKGW
jgi:hypothetical protein